MFREWIALFKDKSLMEAVCADYEELLKSARSAFAETANALLDRQLDADFHEKIEARRKQLFERESSIHRRITEHLCFNPDNQVGTGLTILGSTHDARRLAALCCDLEDLAGMNAEVPFVDEAKVRAVLKRLATGLDRLIAAVKDESALAGLSEELADIKRTCRGEVQNMAASNYENSRSAVVTALTFRFCHRLAAYARAIADAPRVL
ncbi:MAG: hypothetical protein QNK37_31135 [Acidobacteriota bacterium]|nr:hypothetical protein [Acidobacteriota bacterium]